MELVEFEWWRCIDGYRLDRAGLTSASDRFERYRPLEIAGLFAKFAKDTAASAKGMHEFSNRFGLLGGVRADSLWRTHAKPARESVAVDVLLEHHWRMRRALTLFEKGDPSQLIKHCNSADGLAWLGVGLQLDSSGKVGIVFTPPDLIRAMWFQFLQHASSGAVLLRCQHCNEPFPVGTGTGRRNTAKYCSNACKVAAFKARSEGRQKHA